MTPCGPAPAGPSGGAPAGGRGTSAPVAVAAAAAVPEAQLQQQQPGSGAALSAVGSWQVDAAQSSSVATLAVRPHLDLLQPLLVTSSRCALLRRHLSTGTCASAILAVSLGWRKGCVVLE